MESNAIATFQQIATSIQSMAQMSGQSEEHGRCSVSSRRRLEFNDQPRIESGAFGHIGVTTWVADNTCFADVIIRAPVRVAMDPESGVAGCDQIIKIRCVGCADQFPGVQWIQRPRTWRVVRDYYRLT